MLVDFKRVRFLSIRGRFLEIVTERDGVRRFEFESDHDASRAFENWIKLSEERQGGDGQ